MAGEAQRQFDRAVRLTIVPPIPVTGGQATTIVVNPIPPALSNGAPQIHVRFTVTKSLTPEPQRASVTIWGLQKSTRDSIAGAARRVIDWIPGGVRTPLIRVDGRLLPSDPIVTETTAGLAHVIVEAGYGATLSTLFSGVAAPVRNIRQDGREWLTTLQGGDGELQLTQGQASRTFDPGTPAIAVLRYFAEVCALKIAPTAALAQLSTYLLAHGLVAHGRARQGIADMLGALQLTWWVEDGVLWILADGEFVPGSPVLTSPADVPGMIRLLESPMRIDDRGVRVRMRLAPSVRPGRQLIIASSELAGSYRVEWNRHSVDNRSGPCETEAIVRNQDALGL